MKRTKNEVESPSIPTQTPRKHSATTMEGRENELISLAYDAVEERIRNGTATSQELCHFLKLGSTRERLEKETLESENELKKAKVKALQESAHLEQIYNDAIEAMKRYSGAD